MKRAEKMSWSWKAWLGAVSLMLVLVLGLFVEQFSIVSYAQSQGQVTASSANIRKNADPSSQVLGSATQGDSVTINHQTTGTDGNIWYQVFVNAETLGYIRSDLVNITDGTTPTTVTSTTSQTTTQTTTPATTTQTTNEPQAEVTAVEPISASVEGGRRVRVRSNASTTSDIVTTVESGAALTVTGQATGADDKVWYQVEFISNGEEVNGFIRSDYVELSGDLTPVVEEEPEEAPEEVPNEEAVEEEPEVVKDWDTQLQGEDWYLLDIAGAGQYKIADLFDAIEKNKAAYGELESTAKSQKVVIIILVIALIGVGAGAAFLVFRIKDMNDSAYFSQVEKDTMRRRNASRPQSNQKVMHTVGAEKKPAPGGQGRRPEGARPQGSRPAGAPAQGGRPAGAPAQGSRPAGAQAQGSKPTAAPTQGSRPAGNPVPVDRPKTNNDKNDKNGSWKSKNFIAEDDEFEFEFLNWDGEDE